MIFLKHHVPTAQFQFFSWLYWTSVRSSGDHENQLQYMNWLGDTLRYRKKEDWYQITNRIFADNYGSTLVTNYYNSSPILLLKSIYPDHWNIKENQLQYMNSLQKILGYRKIEDWYKVTKNDFEKNHGSGLISKYNSSPYQLLSSVYPNFQWERSKFRKLYSKQQIEWLNFLQKYYGINIQHACNDGEYKIPETRYHADGFCSDTNTIYEYHGDYYHGNPKIFQPDDFNKKIKCTHGELYQKTLKKEEDIRRLGYNLVTMWESDWMRINNIIRKFQRKFRSVSSSSLQNSS